MQIDLAETQKMLEWLKVKLFLNTKVNSARNRSLKRGQVYRCNFGYGIGSEMRKDRPAIVVQNDVGNSHSSNTIVIPVTHNESTLPCIANISSYTDNDGNVILDGQANASNITCVSKARLGDLICNLSSTDMKLVDETIAKTMGIMKYYASINAQLDDKMKYIETLKEQRNTAEDELKSIRNCLELSDNESIVDHLLKVIDKTQI